MPGIAADTMILSANSMHTVGMGSTVGQVLHTSWATRVHRAVFVGHALAGAVKCTCIAGACVVAVGAAPLAHSGACQPICIGAGATTLDHIRCALSTACSRNAISELGVLANRGMRHAMEVCQYRAYLLGSRSLKGSRHSFRSCRPRSARTCC